MSTSQSDPTDDREPPTSWSGVAAGAFVFVVATAYLLAAEIPAGFGAKAPPSLFTLAFWGLLLIPAGGFGVGWILHFPRWSYPYAGLAAAMALYIANASTPGLTFLGYPTFDRELWGLRALIPLAIAAGAGLIVTRSFQPIRTFFTQMGSDWTLPAFMMTGFLPLFVFISFDEIDNRYAFPLELLLGLSILLMVSLYLRSRTSRQRTLILIPGTIAIVAATSIAAGLYWYRLGPENIYIPGMIVMTLCAAGFLLWPFVTLGMARVLNRIGRTGSAGSA
jgi:hypothetical protein